jgi:hypothetical protein
MTPVRPLPALQLRGAWQWLGGSGTVGKRRSVRFEWYQLGSGSGSIGGVGGGTGVAVANGEMKNQNKKKKKKRKKKMGVGLDRKTSVRSIFQFFFSIFFFFFKNANFFFKSTKNNSNDKVTISAAILFQIRQNTTIVTASIPRFQR